MTHKKFDGYVCVRSSAGTGKTHTLINRLKEMLASGIKPENILVFTFTVAGAGELRERIGADGNGMRIGTMHSVFNEILLDILKHRNEKLPKLMNDIDVEKVIRDILKAERCKKANPKDVMIDMMMKINSGIVPNRYSTDMTERVMWEFQKKNYENNTYTFDDMLYRTYYLLKGNPEFTEKYSSKWKYILVDEFQDSNQLQVWLLQILSSKHKNMFAIGDHKQTIYGFRGSNHKFIENFDEYFPKAKVSNLEKTYRTPLSVLELANNFVESNFNDIRIETASSESGFVDAKRFGTQLAESSFVAELCKDGKETFVLSRTNAGLVYTEFEMLYNGLDYKVLGDQYFYKNKHVKNMLNFLKMLWNIDKNQGEVIAECIGFCFPYTRKATKQKIILENCSLDMLSELNVFGENDYASDRKHLVMMQRFVKRIADEYGFFEKKSKYNIVEILHDMMATFDYETIVLGNQDSCSAKLDSKVISAFTGLCREVFSIPAVGDKDNIETLFKFIGKMKSSKHDGNITLSTVHKAKGLESDRVIIIGVDDEIFPSMKKPPKEIQAYIDSSPEAQQLVEQSLEEEKRLFYVAITRPKKELIVTSVNPSEYFNYVESFING